MLEESKKETETLNSIYKQLIDSNSKWERLKKNSTSIYKYLGIINSSLCNNSQLEDKADCLVNKVTSK